VANAESFQVDEEFAEDEDTTEDEDLSLDEDLDLDDYEDGDDVDEVDEVDVVAVVVEDVDDVDDDVAQEDDVVEVAGAAVTHEEEDVEDEEEDETDLDEDTDETPEEEGEASLDVLLARDKANDEEDLGRLEEPRDGLSVPAQPISASEFTCRSCFLVKNRAQLADEEALICFDCA
jgi:ribonuclease E